jgi:hypothetical protein
MAAGNNNDDQGKGQGTIEVEPRETADYQTVIVEVQQAVKAYRGNKPVASPAIIERCLAAWDELGGLDDADWDAIEPHLVDEIEVLQALFATWRQR